MSPVSTNTLDHLIHITPPGELSLAVDRFTSIGFNVLPGGNHSDGLTYNALVILADGVYLELIAFIHPVEHYPAGSPLRARRENHRWATRPTGWNDWANLGLDKDVGEIITRRAAADDHPTKYKPPAAGGRERPDGVQLKWRVTMPDTAHGVGTLPFFCEDITPRENRVPVIPPSNAVHPSTAEGIAYVKLLATPDRYHTLIEQLSAVFGSKPTSSTQSSTSWDVSTPHGAAHPQVILSLPDDTDEAQRSIVEGTGQGIWEVGFYITQSKDKKIEGGPLGRVAWVHKQASAL